MYRIARAGLIEHNSDVQEKLGMVSALPGEESRCNPQGGMEDVCRVVMGHTILD